MDSDRQDGIGGTRAAILHHLRRDWPDSVDLSARALGVGVATDDFLAAAVTLQDEGLIMYEALLVGTGPAPLLMAAVLTRKGQEAATAS
ncbi:hypothetical protein [Croceibacterium ferulae]|uniref:hypothetical protein n=1 Tax=Croceibacterium ferulae TaxID=1854641 RepID=UPI000F875B72|nr:hypothetical protein [Croceibacterium ferulae]